MKKTEYLYRFLHTSRYAGSVWNVAHPSPAEGKMSLFKHVNNS